MSETLWITLPSNEENKLREVINLITSKNLTSLSINQLIEKLENNQAADWIEVLDKYNSIPSINNINTSQTLTRAMSVKNKFDRKNSENQIIYPNLKNELFTPNQLLSLVILCYSNPSLIGPKLCKALNDNNEADIKKEILENSSYVRSQNRVVPWTLNLRLANYALYANDTSVRLPVEVINRVKNETIQNGRTVHIVDQRGGFNEWVNGTERVSRTKRFNIDTTVMEAEKHLPTRFRITSRNMGGDFGNLFGHDPELSSLNVTNNATNHGEHVSEALSFNVTHNGSEFVPEVLPLNETHNGSELAPEMLAFNVTNNTANTMGGEDLAIASLVGFHIFKNLPVISPVLRNLGKDLVATSKYIGSFFSKNSSEPEQLEQKTALLSPITKA